jgi:CRP-like cAMP-binding protein
LEHYLPLTSKEKAALARLEEQERSYRRGSLIRRENDRASELYILRSGWLASFVLLDDGSRQILRLSFPGDLVGGAGTAFTLATESLEAITDVTICPFDKSSLRTLFEDHPRLAALVFVVTQAERVSFTDRLASVGRTSAKARVAALLLDSLARLRVMDRSLSETFPFPLTQEEIGDATGLTAVHVNRMIRALVEERLIERQNGLIRLLNEDRLIRMANYVDRYAELDTSWMPPSAG